MLNKIKKLISAHVSDKDAEKKLLELVEELNNEKEKYQQYLSLLEDSIRNDYDSILITELQLEKPGPKIVYVNDGFKEMTGYSRDEVIGKTPRILQGEKTDRAVLDKLKQRLKKGQSFFGHTVNYRKDGTEFINQWDIHPLTNKDGEITHWVSYQHDITERKRSEKKVVDTEIEFDKLIEESKKTLIDVDEQGNIVTSNKAFRGLMGFDNEELKKKKFWEILGDEHIESFKNKFESFKPSDFNGQEYELSIINKMNNSIEVRANLRLLASNGQKIVRIAFQNKSLQKRIVDMLTKRNQDFDRAFDEAKDFSYKVIPIGSEEYEFDYFSDTFSKITGIDISNESEIVLSDFIHVDDLQKVINHFKVVLEGKPNTELFRVKSIDGKYVEVIDYAKPEWDRDESEVKAIKGATSTEISSENNA